MFITEAELAENLDAYIEALESEDILITRDGTVVARLTKLLPDNNRKEKICADTQ